MLGCLFTRTQHYLSKGDQAACPVPRTICHPIVSLTINANQALITTAACYRTQTVGAWFLLLLWEIAERMGSPWPFSRRPGQQHSPGGSMDIEIIPFLCSWIAGAFNKRREI